MKRKILFVLLPVVCLTMLGACESRSAAKIFPEYVAKKEAKEAKKLKQEEAENTAGEGGETPRFFRESDSR